MLTDAALILIGLVFLVGGGESLVRGASGIALLARMTPAVVGLTVVAAGTSMPELVVSLQSAVAGSSALALGNVVGSNIFNIGAILGFTALVRPLRVHGSIIRSEWPVMLLAVLQLHLLARDGTIDRLEGACLLAGLTAFVTYAVIVARRSAQPAEISQYEEVTATTASFGRVGAAAVLLNIAALALGIGLLAAGSSALVRGAVSIAETLGVSQTVIGLTIVAAGTSLPELVTSIVAAMRGRDDIAVANVIGSNIFNALGIAGSTALVTPLAVPEVLLSRDDWWMLAFCLALFPLMRSGMRIVRWEGAVLLAGFAAYLGLLLSTA